MNGMRQSLSAALSIVVVLAGTARATVWPGEWFVSGGYGIMAGKTTLETPALWQYGGQPFLAKLAGTSMVSGCLLYHFTPQFGLGMEFINRTENSGSYNLIGGGFGRTWAGSYSASHNMLLAVARYVFMPERTWNPYVIGGAGIDAVDITATSSLPSYSRNLLAGSAGFGIERSVTANSFADVELGIAGVSSTTDDQVKLSSEIMPYVAARFGFDIGGIGRQ